MVIGMTSDYGPNILNTPGLAPMVTGDQPDYQLASYAGSWSSVALPDGSFAVSWSTTPPSGGAGDVYFQRLSADGNLVDVPLPRSMSRSRLRICI